MWKIQLFKLNYDDREVQAVADVVKSGWITMGEKTIGFEKRFGEFLGGEIKCTAVSSGTAALHMALLALGVGSNANMRARKSWTKQEIVELFNYMLPEFKHKETHKYLDQRM
ncbi:DegT/DnrJ/EryC1/StrS family aminotransferase [bacterium]|nr:DegT/DnrJ/EryC1/StrS family aminotransferase [bacterium]